VWEMQVSAFSPATDNTAVVWEMQVSAFSPVTDFEQYHATLRMNLTNGKDLVKDLITA